MVHRIKKLRERFDLLGIDAFLVTFQPHLRYLSGFSGSNGLAIVTKRSLQFITDSRYAQQVKVEVTGWKVFIAEDSLFEVIKQNNLFRHGLRVGFDGNTVTYSQFKELKKIFPKVKLLPKSGCIDDLASIKEPDEVNKIRMAASITDKTFAEILLLLRPGVRELDIAAEISYRQRKSGAESDAFEPIVVSGERSALPHGRATSKPVAHGDVVTLDFGCVYEGYHSDLTRTIVIGKVKPELKKIYTIVLNAQLKALKAAKSGVKAKDLDAVARDYINGEGYGKFYRHSLGHGLGLQIHEPPRISNRSNAILNRGNVVTIEPGIYIPKLGGVRIEDDIVITNGRCENLTRSPKELIVV
ncbi:MAG TPA: Xaa-Pro peptidase family protein [Bacteroidota bacterium]|nr:Xaa-Pro peptidase family protein [Bacteroidota bacterium]